MILDRSILYGLLYKFVNVKTICHLFKNSKMYDDILYRAKVSHLTLHHNIRYKKPQMNEICSVVCPPLLRMRNYYSFSSNSKTIVELLLKIMNHKHVGSVPVVSLATP